MQLLDTAAAPSIDRAALVDHYKLVAPLMEKNFGHIPIVWTTANPDPAGRPFYHCKFFGHYSHLDAEHVVHLASIGAQEFHSWFPRVEDPARARFARFLLERQWDDANGAAEETIRGAALLFKSVLDEHGLAGIPVLDGLGGVAVFVPLDGGPSYSEVRVWAHGIARAAIAAHPERFSEAPNTHADGRVHIHVSSNAVDRWSIVPYSVRVRPMCVATPVTWEELADADMLGVAVAQFPARLDTAGDIFSAMQKPKSALALIRRGPMRYPHGTILSTIIQILSDGKPRTPAEILSIAQERKLPCSETSQGMLHNMTSYIEIQTARGLKPLFVATGDHRFRLNEPADDWPDYAAHSAPAHELEALIKRLQQSASDSQNPENFEVAVCDAFAALGLLTTHVGGHGAPDGYADAPLGTLGYRVMFECKSGDVVGKAPNCFEASKYRDAYGAKYCALIGNQSRTDQQELLSEIKTHGIALWSAADIVRALRANLNPLELVAAFAPGAVAQEVLPDLIWAREHGVAKRVRIIAEIVRSAGWAAQCAAAQANAPGNAPLLTEDAAMLVVDQELAARGAHVNCTREEVRLAFAWLTSPLLGAATLAGDESAIVILSAG